MPGTISVPYQELFDGVTESVDQTSIGATKKYLVAWGDRWKFAQDMAGKAVKVGNNSIVRSLPYQYPDNKNMYAVGLAMEPAGTVYCTTPGSYDKAIITVTFGTLPYDITNSQGSQNTVYRSISLNMSAQLMTLPTSPFQFLSVLGGTPIANAVCNLNPGFLMPSCEITITSHQVPYVPLDLIFSLIGSVNNAPFYDAPIGTLLFAGVQCSRQATSEGLQAWDVEYKFVFRPIEWNKFYSGIPGIGWAYLVDKTTNLTIYQYNDFTQIP